MAYPEMARNKCGAPHLDFGQTVWESRSQKPEIGSQKLIFRQQTGKTGRFDAVKSSLKILGELFEGLSRSGFCPNYRIINPRCCYPRKKSLWNHFYDVFATFCGFFGSFYAFGDNPAIADCPKSKIGVFRFISWRLECQ